MSLLFGIFIGEEVGVTSAVILIFKILVGERTVTSRFGDGQQAANRIFLQDLNC
jgi:hypothetical protein